jgi:hypothetical protein
MSLPRLRSRQPPVVVVKPKAKRFAPSSDDDHRHYHDANGTAWRPRRHDSSRIDTKLALALSAWRLAHAELPQVRFYERPVPARIDISGAALLLRWEAGKPRIEVCSGPVVWITGQVDAVALVSITGDEGTLRQLGKHIAERLQS